MTGQAPRSVLITGATGGLGAALAQTYAGPGVTLILQGRRAARLDEVVEACRAAGASVEAKVLDLRQRADWLDWLTTVSERLPLDLVIVNAGINVHAAADGSGENWEQAQELLDVNIGAAWATVAGVLPAMRRRGAGQIALMSSLAADFGLAVTPSYSASKAAVRAYGEGLRGGLAAAGIRVNVIMPGYVSTAMASAMPGPKPWMWTAERAARVIRLRLARNQARIRFPFLLALGCRFLSVFPVPVSQWLVEHLGFRS